MDISSISSRLRYLDASDVDDPAIAFDGLQVRGSDGHKLGDLDGFLVDEMSGRVYYSVVDAGGWFTSRRILLPIGHTRLAEDGRSLHVDVTRETLKGYPAFDEHRFPEFSDDEWRAFEQRMAYACCPDETRDIDAAVQYDTLRHYAQPSWWHADHRSRDRYQPLAGEWRDRQASAAPARDAAPPRARETRERELVTARDRDAADVSPHQGGRAQPGDVLGIETGGEQSHIGDTSDDENTRRRNAERAAGKRRGE